MERSARSTATMRPSSCVAAAAASSPRCTGCTRPTSRQSTRRCTTPVPTSPSRWRRSPGASRNSPSKISTAIVSTSTGTDMKNDKLLRGASLLLALVLLPLAALAEDAWDGDAIAKLQAQMASGATTSRKLVEHYLARIAAIDAHGPSINSVIEVNPDALKIADELDAERARKGPRGP